MNRDQLRLALDAMLAEAAAAHRLLTAEQLKLIAATRLLVDTRDDVVDALGAIYNSLPARR